MGLANYLPGEDDDTRKAAFFFLIDYHVYAQEVLDYHRSKARIRIVTGPARTSKSKSGGVESAFHVFPNVDRETRQPVESRMNWIVATDYRNAKEWDYVKEALVDGREQHGLPYKIEKFHDRPDQGVCKLVLNFGKKKGGGISRGIIEVKSAGNERTIQGEEVYHAIISEAAEQDQKILTRYLQTRAQIIDIPTTPKRSAYWVLDLIQLAEAGEPSIEVFWYPIHANPTYDRRRYEDALSRAESQHGKGKAHLDPFFAEQFLGHWTMEEDKLLPFRWQDSPGCSSHIEHSYPEDLAYASFFWSCDYGFDDPAAALLWAVRADGRLLICREIYERHLHAGAFVARIRAEERACGIEANYYVPDPQRPEVAAVMRVDHRLPIWSMNKIAVRDRAAGFTALGDAFADDPATGRPRLTIHDSCRNLIRELKQLRRRDGHASDEWSKAAIAGDCHAIDALRYGIMTRPTPRASRMTTPDWLAQHRQLLARIQAASKPMSGVRDALGYTRGIRAA